METKRTPTNGEIRAADNANRELSALGVTHRNGDDAKWVLDEDETSNSVGTWFFGDIGGVTGARGIIRHTRYAIAYRIRSLRQSLGLEQSEFGRLLGYGSPQVRVSELEHGARVSPQIALLLRYIERYGPLL